MASISISNVRVDGDDVIVTVNGSVDTPTEIELVWASTADSPTDIPVSRQNFSVGAGSFSRDVTLELFLPTGAAAVLSVTANTLGQDTATDSVTVQVQQEGAAGGGGGLSTATIVGAGVGLVGVAWFLSQRNGGD
jgi:hypothetical protein